MPFTLELKGVMSFHWAWWGARVGVDPVLPWELQAANLWPTMPVHRLIAGPPAVTPTSVEPTGPQQESTSKAKATTPAAVGRKRSGPPPGQQDTTERERALRQWVEILKVVQAGGGAAKAKDLERAVKETMEAKATATLATRASSWKL